MTNKIDKIQMPDDEYNELYTEVTDENTIDTDEYSDNT